MAPDRWDLWRPATPGRGVTEQGEGALRRRAEPPGQPKAIIARRPRGGAGQIGSSELLASRRNPDSARDVGHTGPEAGDRREANWMGSGQATRNRAHLFSERLVEGLHSTATKGLNT